MRPNSTPKAKRINASKWCKKVDEEKMRAKKKTILFWKRKKKHSCFTFWSLTCKEEKNQLNPQDNLLTEKGSKFVCQLTQNF
jgi:hypothetical protein